MAKKDTMKEKKLKSKDELLSIMNDHLIIQQEIAETLKEKALNFMNDEDDEDYKGKKKNRHLNEYNQQVDAISRTASALIRIQSSNLQNDEKEEEHNESLID